MARVQVHHLYLLNSRSFCHRRTICLFLGENNLFLAASCAGGKTSPHILHVLLALYLKRRCHTLSELAQSSALCVLSRVSKHLFLREQFRGLIIACW